MNRIKVGISSIGLRLPQKYLAVENLAKLRHVEPEKYLTGLGCKDIALCSENESIVALAAEAAKRALSRWHGNIEDIGLLAVGTESALDMSRPLSAFVAEELGIKGAVRSYEVKHACYGGTLAIRQALEWKLSGVAPKKAALVIAADIALYKMTDPGEPTQGAGAIAFIIDTPDIAEIDPVSYPWSKPVFDFWRPTHEQFPLVDGDLSIESYKEATRSCFQAMLSDKKLDINQFFESFRTLCFHIPFPKMVKKAFLDLCKHEGWSEQISEEVFQNKIVPTMEWNKLSGNAYTASLWISVAKTLCDLQLGEKIAAFSYGSGCGAELLLLEAGPDASKGKWSEDIQNDLEKRIEISGEIYEAIRKANLEKNIE